jgi:glucose-1-phosphate cytidylyltransferase
MRYYAHFGHTDFVLALGYRGQMIRDYFLHYQECMTNDFTLSEGGSKVDVHSRDIQDWRITFVDTGLHANIGQRLMAVRKYVEDEDMFLANYADGLSDIPIDVMVDGFTRANLVAQFASVHPSQSFHYVKADANGRVMSIGSVNDADLRINGGYFILRQSIFDYMRPGEELVEQPFARLIEEDKLGTYRHEGFWQPMDTFKDKITFDRMEARGNCPWMVWK